jgi:hypothetical protein
MPLIALVEAALTTIVRHDYIHKGHSFGFSESHGSFTNSHVSQFKKKPYIHNQTLPRASLLT